MDRISALRNIEDALGKFEQGDVDLATMEREVVNVLRTYATDFADEDLAAYRARGDDRADGLVVVAGSADEAEARIRDLLDGGEGVSFSVERLG